MQRQIRAGRASFVIGVRLNGMWNSGGAPLFTHGKILQNCCRFARRPFGAPRDDLLSLYLVQHPSCIVRRMLSAMSCDLVWLLRWGEALPDHSMLGNRKCGGDFGLCYRGGHVPAYDTG